MSDLRWDDVKDWFDPTANGSVPDLVVTAGSGALGKRVALFAEGDGDHPPMLAYEVDPDRVVLLLRE